MLVELKVPVLAESVAEATLVSWLKQPGERVEQGENLIEVETDKVMLEVTAPETGTLKEIKKGINETVLSDEVIGIIDTDGEASSSIETQTQKQYEARSLFESKTPKLSPAVRKMLEERQLKPADITSIGTKERITKADILEHLKSQTAAAPEKPSRPESEPRVIPLAGEGRSEKRVPMTHLRRRIAERLLMAQRENAILTTFNDVNMQSVMALRERHQSKFEEVHGIRLGFMSFFVLAAVEALKRFPAVNASIDDDDIVYHDFYDIGIAVSSPRGLVVPIVRDVNRLGVAQIEASIVQFARKAKNNELSIEELTGGTFTITNGGVFGSLLSTPILNPPQSAILGMHKVQKRPVAINGQVVICPMMYLALSYDHRIIDGREAVQFLVAIKELIEDPTRLMLQV